MALTNKQKELRDKKVEELNAKIFEKQTKINSDTLLHDEAMARIQAEIDEAELLKQALEGLK